MYFRPPNTEAAQCLKNDGCRRTVKLFSDLEAITELPKNCNGDTQGSP